MTSEKRREMREYKEKAMAYEQKIKGKRVSLDSGVMITSTEMQKLDNYESPTNIIKEPTFCNVKNTIKFTKQDSIKTDSSNSSETPTLASGEEDNNTISLNDSSLNKESTNINSHNIRLKNNFCDILTLKQESTHDLTLTNSSIHNEDISNSSPLDNESINVKSENISLVNNSCDTQNTVNNFTVNNSTGHNEDILTTKQIPRLRSNSYTLSSPSPIMVAFLNSQVQQQLLEPKSVDNNIKHTNKSKSEPLSIYVTNDCNDNVFKTKSVSLQSVSGPFTNQKLTNELVKNNYQNEPTNDKIICDQSQDGKGSVTSVGTNFSYDESVVGSVKTVFHGNSYENNSTPNSVTCKFTKHCCCKHSDDEYSLSSNNIHYKTPEELNIEAERLRIEKLDIEKRHQEELSSLLKKQREEQEQIAVRYYLISKSSSGVSLNDSECSELFSKQYKCHSPSTQSEILTNNDRSIFSDTSIISNCSTNKNLVCSSPRQKTPSRSPYLQQNIKLYHRMRGGLTTRWTKAPTEVENAAATIINAGVRGYLTRRLLRTEKAQLLKKTILDSLKTALIMHMELKNQQLTESDLELHQRIINQVIILNLEKAKYNFKVFIK